MAPNKQSAIGHSSTLSFQRGGNPATPEEDEVLMTRIVNTLKKGNNTISIQHRNYDRVLQQCPTSILIKDADLRTFPIGARVVYKVDCDIMW